MQNQIVVRAAVGSEQKALEALQLCASLQNPGDREALLANPDAIHLPLEQIQAGQVFVIELDGLVCGFATILPREDRNSELDAVFVEPDKWRLGLGRKLIDYCAVVAHIQGSQFLYVVGNPHAEGFYTACGFEMLGTTQTQFGKGLLFRKELQKT